MSWVNPTAPNVADFLTFVMGQTGATFAQLPSEPGDQVGRVTISASGSSITTISISASVSPTGAIATFVAGLTNESVSSVWVTNPGNGYITAPTLTSTVNVGATAPALTAVLAPVYMEWALQYAIDRVLGGDMDFVPAYEYILAVYQLALHWLICWAPDPAGQNLFANMRSNSGFGIFAFKGGLIASGSDSGTSASIAIPEGLKDLPLEALDCLKTPWGRAYLAWQQKFGPAAWGVS